jgi:hypothetical protein
MCALTSSSPPPSSHELLKLDHDSRHYLTSPNLGLGPAWSVPSWCTLKVVDIVPKRTSTRHYASSFLMCDRFREEPLLLQVDRLRSFRRRRKHFLRA